MSKLKDLNGLLFEEILSITNADLLNDPKVLRAHASRSKSVADLARTILTSQKLVLDALALESNGEVVIADNENLKDFLQ